MNTLLILIGLLFLIYFITIQAPKIMFPYMINKSWATMRYDGPWYGEDRINEI
jgi:hypothetical protein